MNLKYGAYRHAANEASVTISKQGIFTDAGIACGVRERWSIQGRLQAADQASLSTAIEELEAAYRRQGQDVGFYFDDDQPTAHAIASAATNGGVRVTVPPSFPEGSGAEYSTFRNYLIVLEAERIDASATLLNWTESISFFGGGPQFVFLEPMVGPPQKQLLKQMTTFRATQAGEAIGYLGYPIPAAPIWPEAEHIDQRRLRYDLPQRHGPLGRPTYTRFRVSWSYAFEHSGPLVGNPSAWPA